MQPHKFSLAASMATVPFNRAFKLKDHGIEV